MISHKTVQKYYTKTKEFKERVFYLLKQQGFIKTDLMGFIEMTEKEGVAKVLKGLQVYNV